MKGYSIGIDCGSTLCKGVLYGHGQVQGLAIRPSSWDMAATGQQVLAELLALCPEALGDIAVVSTGYGREKVAAAKTITEITCHARGAEYLRPGVSTVIDIGGQDYKVIGVNSGKVISFQMNDKCAAGSGRFLEMVLHRLEIGLEELDGLLAENKAVTINSTCAVFAESEIIGLLAQGFSREEILGGVVASMAAKIAGSAARVGVATPVILSGGLAGSRGVALALAKALGEEVSPVEQGLYAGAVGAACLALEG